MKPLTKQNFLKQVKEFHGDRYNYDKVEYTNNKAFIIITRKEHGDFEQRAFAHKGGQGCPKCSNRFTKKLTLLQFIQKSNKQHDNKFSYEKSVYVNNKTDLTITCPIHGDFEQAPDVHMSATFGCIKCSGRCQELAKETFAKKRKESSQ